MKLAGSIPRPLRRKLGALRDFVMGRWFAHRARTRLTHPGKSRAHDLPGELIVSLTSYPARFGTLHLTLACLLDQTVKADRTILWIADQDLPDLPVSVRSLDQHGLEIRACDDLRSFKKLVPALEAFPDAFIVTADDDIYYPRDWLEKLVDAAQADVVACHRVHRIRRTADGRLAPYLEWDFDVQDSGARKASIDIMPTGVAGVLYPPGSLDPRVTDREQFLRLCPEGDDLWFYWCARLAGTRHKKVGGRMQIRPWRGSQSSTLWDANDSGGNDQMVGALEAALGRLS